MPVVRSIADTADADMAVVISLVIGLTEPLRQLDDLWRLAARADSDDMPTDGELVAAHRVLEPTRRQTISGGGPAMPGSVPGLPGRGDLDRPGLPGTRSPKTVDNLFGLLKPKRPGSWDPDDWCPTLPWWRDLPSQVDWDVVARIRCLMDVGRRMRARAAIAPPVRPARFTWT